MQLIWKIKEVTKMDEEFWKAYELSGYTHPVQFINAIEHLIGRLHEVMGDDGLDDDIPFI